MARGRPPSAKTLVDRQLGRNIPIIPADDQYVVPNSSGIGSYSRENFPDMGVNTLQFNLDFDDGSAEGRLQWNKDDGTLEVGMPGGVVNLQIGQELLIKTKNMSGVNITNGQPVRISGGSGSNPTIELANATDSTSGSVGLATENIDDGQFGFVTTFGLVRDIDTSLWAAGSAIFLGNTDGALTNIPPSGTERKVFLGVVTRQHATEGVLWVSPVNVSFPEELSGVTYGSMYNHDVPTTVTIGTIGTAVRVPS